MEQTYHFMRVCSLNTEHISNNYGLKIFFEILGVSSKTIKRHIKEIEHANYIGRGANGHWEISEEK